MKRMTITILAILLGNAVASFATLIPTEQLEQYFIDLGIEYEIAPNFTRNATSGEYMFFPTRDPQDDETIGIFFELNTGNSLNDSNMHWAMGLRGPHAGTSVNHYGGRGLAIGHLSFFDDCSNIGGFIESFTANEQRQHLQLTYCQPELLFNYSTYRIDIHVSKRNVLVRIWHKRFNPHNFEVTYNMVTEYSCVTDDGPDGRTGFCPEHPLDSGFGGMFIGSAFLDPNYWWSARNVFVAFF